MELFMLKITSKSKHKKKTHQQKKKKKTKKKAIGLHILVLFSSMVLLQLYHFLGAHIHGNNSRGVYIGSVLVLD
jgi:hypothetical protein